MVDPWDSFTIALSGDEDETQTYEWVDRVLSTWEIIEFGLSLAYCALEGDKTGRDKINEYGAGNIFRERLAILQKSAERYFMRYPDQEIESQFIELCRHLAGYSARRNEVAHGAVHGHRRHAALQSFHAARANKYRAIRHRSTNSHKPISRCRIT